MPGITEDRERQVVPLWRAFSSTLLRGELASVSLHASKPYSEDALVDLVHDWNNAPTLSVAADLVGAAFVIGEYVVATDAAAFILAHGSAPPLCSAIATLYLAGAKPPLLSSGSTSGSERKEVPFAEYNESFRLMYVQVRDAKRKLERYPHNAVLWGNLARLYLALGVPKKADRAMRIALSISPQNRFLIRAAARLYLHVGEKEHAHRLLADAVNLKRDPWLLASEIATAAARGRTSQNVKLAQRILSKENFRPFHVSELASAVGTLELKAGSSKAGKRLIAFSLQEPAENAIAQAAYVERNISAVYMERSKRVGSSEASAWCAWMEGDWQTALHESLRWHIEQPFSSRPAMLGSHVASAILENHDQGVQFAQQGLLGNPNDAVLSNNLAFSLAMIGRTAEAKKILQSVDYKRLSVADSIALLATSGLACYRSGDPVLGRQHYESAIRLADRDYRGILARIYFASEELRIGSKDGERLRQEALKAASSLVDPAWLVIAKRLETYTGQREAKVASVQEG